jgi:predicted AlkP superfamily phosphohydrolase/phosphomutase
VEKAYRREEVYEGASLDEAPDIVVKWATHEEYTYAFRVSSKSRTLQWIEELDPHRQDNMAFFSGKSGSHRDNGIFLAEGPEVIAGKTFSGARIIDVAPTILHLLGVPTPADMDGRALIEVLEGEAASPMEIGAAAGAVAEVDEETYTEEDKIVINERLRALGYID